MPGAASGLVTELRGERPVSPADVAAARPGQHRGHDGRVVKGDPLSSLIDTYQASSLSGGQISRYFLSRRGRTQQAEVACPLQRGQQQQVAGGRGQGGDPERQQSPQTVTDRQDRRQRGKAKILPLAQP